MSNFLDVQKVEKGESLIDIQMHRVVNLLFIIFQVYIDFKI